MATEIGSTYLKYRQGKMIKKKKHHIFIKLFATARSNRSVWGNVLLVLFLVFMAFLFLFPVIFMANNAFKPLHELLKFPPDIIVKTPTLNNFLELRVIFQDSVIPLLRYIFNTIFILVVGTAGQIIFASMAAYPLAKYRFFGSEVISRIIVLSLMFSPVVTAVPNYVIISKLGLIDTYWAIILPAFAATLGLYLMKNFMEQIPSSLVESASIDGANDFIIFWRVIMPLVKPAWITLFIVSFQNMWGVTGDMYIYKENLKTFSYALGQIARVGIARQGVMAAVSLIMFLIPAITFIVAQSNVIETMTTSGLKE
mgnify:CR=1 FL=1|jgi:ABC-type glycerol-3-phosphate transport system permease component